MKKSCCLLFVFVASVSASFGQQKKVLHFEQIKEGSYTIRLLPSSNSKYGYDIVNSGQILAHQPFSPFGQGTGISGLKKDEALKLARWMIVHHEKTGQMPPSILPTGVARELNISLQ